MGVYAKGFIKSEDESDCKWYEEVYLRPFPYCHFLRDSCRGVEKCPLIEVPEPHGDLIDRDALPTPRVEWEDIVNAPTIIQASEEGK